MIERGHVFLQAAAQFVLPGWAVIVGFIASVGVAFTILWNWLDGLIDRAVDQAVDEALEKRFDIYEVRQAQIMADVAYIRGVLDQMNHQA